MALRAEGVRLTSAQDAAWRHVCESAAHREPAALDRLRTALAACGCPEGLFEEAAASIREHARVIVHFHPDRIGPDGVSVAEALLREGRYRSQFETGLSSGGLTAFPGGDRDRWEQSLFGGAYHAPGASLSERPTYGALEVIRHPDGPWPRFGSCYFVLASAVSRRTSFTFAGSERPDAVERLGTIDRMAAVLAPLVEEVAAGARAPVPWPPHLAPTLGIEDLTVTSLLERIRSDLARPRRHPSEGVAGRVLDSGIEAQVHGAIEMGRDVDRLVADPAFSATETGELLRALSVEYSFALEWHVGFRLPATDVPPDFRGEAVAGLATHVARDGMVDAAAIGNAERLLRGHPEQWRDFGEPADVLQYLKQLWHVLVHHGRPYPEQE